MCIVIDTNALSKVFKSTDAKHAQYKPILEWIISGRGMLVIGGSTYHNEIFITSNWFTKIFRLLRQSGKVITIDYKKVDAQEKKLKTTLIHKNFDDPHILALLGISRCGIVCTGDDRSFPFIQNKQLYPKGVIPPAIYHRLGNKKLLCDSYISSCCTPPKKLSKKIATNMKLNLE